METDDRRLLDAALRELDAASPHAPSGPGVRALVATLGPVIHVRATRVLLAHGGGAQLADLRTLVDELVQTIFSKLFEDRARVLRLWTADGGLSLKNWVGRFATFRARDAVRRDRRDPLRDNGAPPEFLASLRDAGTSVSAIEAEQLWVRVRQLVEADLTPKGREVLHLVFDLDASTVEIREQTGLTDDAIFQWRRRLRIALRDAWEQLSSEGVR